MSPQAECVEREAAEADLRQQLQTVHRDFTVAVQERAQADAAAGGVRGRIQDLTGALEERTVKVRALEVHVQELEEALQRQDEAGQGQLQEALEVYVKEVEECHAAAQEQKAAEALLQKNQEALKVWAGA